MNWYKIIKISNIENILKNINIKQENINDITLFLNNIQDTKIKGKYIAAIKEGIKSNPNFNINDLKNINIKQNYIPSSKAQELLNRYKNNPISNWLKKELSKNNEANFQILKDNINHIIDWIKDENIDINNYKLEDAIKLSNEWTSKTFKNSGDKYSSDIVDMQFKDGFTMKKVTPEDATVEGKKMNHCVGSYEDRIKKNKVEVYSLRDKNNEPHVTIAIIYGETVTELKGNSNSNPNDKYGKYIKEWLNKHSEIKYYKNEKNAEEYGLEDVNKLFVDFPMDMVKGEEEYVMKGIKYNIHLLNYISNKLKNDINFWKKVLKEKGEALEYVPTELRTQELILIAVKSNGISIRDIPKEDRTKEICSIAVSDEGRAIAYVPNELKTYELCFKAVESYGYNLSYVPENLRSGEMCAKAVKSYPHSLQFVPDELKTYEMCLEAVKGVGDILYYVPERFKTYELCLEAVKNYGFALDFVPKEFITKELCLKAVEKHGNALSYVPHKLRTLEMCLKAVESDIGSSHYAPYDIKNNKEFIDKVNQLKRK